MRKPASLFVVFFTTLFLTVSSVPAFASEDQPLLEQPGEGKITIYVQVPEPLEEGATVAIPGTFTSWDSGNAQEVGQAITLVEGTTTWYVGTFDYVNNTDGVLSVSKLYAQIPMALGFGINKQ